MRSLYFIKPCRPYNVGEIAGFDKYAADRMVAEGVAIPIEEKIAFENKVAAEDAKKPVEKPAKKAAKKRVAKKSK